MPTRRRKAGVPHRVVNRRKIPEFVICEDEDGKNHRVRIPIVTIHEVHYYEGDIITEIDDSAQCLIDRGFLVPADGGKMEVSDDG